MISTSESHLLPPFVFFERMQLEHDLISPTPRQDHMSNDRSFQQMEWASKLKSVQHQRWCGFVVDRYSREAEHGHRQTTIRDHREKSAAPCERIWLQFQSLWSLHSEYACVQLEEFLANWRQLFQQARSTFDNSGTVMHPLPPLMHALAITVIVYDYYYDNR
jgi:hypothetical protein